MATPSSLSHFLLLPLLLFLDLHVQVSGYWYPSMTLTIVNNCPYTIWPAIQPNSGCAVLERGGFELPALCHRSFPAPHSRWSGRIWARTFCSSTRSHNRFSCKTGDCGGRIKCQGHGGSPPATLAQLSLHEGGREDISTYSVSLVDGFNLPMTVTPHEGRGQCPVVGCRRDLLKICPPKLKLKSGRKVVGCRSGCDVFHSDKLCCRGLYGRPGCCKESGYSRFFKKCCPSTYTYAQDQPSLPQHCSAPKELKVIFCP